MSDPRPRTAPTMPTSTTSLARLSRGRVLAGALDLVDREGGSALTMRRLGAELGVEAMSLYHHVQSREDLLDGVADILVADLPIATRSHRWDTAVRAFASGVRTVALRHPTAFQLVGMRPLTPSAAVPPVGSLLLRLRAAGMTPGDAVATYRTVTAFARGFALAEIAGFTLADDAAGRGADESGELAPFMLELSGDQDRAFRRGLALVVSGIRHQLHAGGASSAVTSRGTS